MYVNLVFVVHVGGSRGVTSSTDHIMNIHAWITLNGEFIRTCLFVFLLYVEIQGRVSSILTFFFDFTGFQVPWWVPGCGMSETYVKSICMIHVGCGTRDVT
jgi:hypothetical protein